VGCGIAIAAAILLRPDGGLLLTAIGGYLAFLIFDQQLRRVQLPAGISPVRLMPPIKHLLLAGLVITFISLAPLIPWTWRNFRTFGHFQPLAPRYANEDSEFVPLGFNRWVRTWMADYASVEEIYWAVPGNTIDENKLPLRAFDSEAQRRATGKLLADYNHVLHIPPELDERFQQLAEQRIRAAPFRYYVRLPLLRIADMWLRPRTELLPCDTRWWEFNDDIQWSILAVALGSLNLLYMLAAGGGLLRTKFLPYFALLFALVVVRSLFLGSLENPEPRYTLECYPAVIVMASTWFAHPKS
jgi:hypothetical protein